MRPDGDPEQTLEVPGDEGFKPLVSRASPLPGPPLDEGQRGVKYPLTKRQLVEHFRTYVQPRLNDLLRYHAYTSQVQQQFNEYVTQYYQRIDPRFNVVCDTRLAYGVLYVEPHDLSRPIGEDTQAADAQEGHTDGPVPGASNRPDVECHGEAGQSTLRLPELPG